MNDKLLAIKELTISQTLTKVNVQIYYLNGHIMVWDGINWYNRQSFKELQDGASLYKLYAKAVKRI